MLSLQSITQTGPAFFRWSLLNWMPILLVPFLPASRASAQQTHGSAQPSAVAVRQTRHPAVAAPNLTTVHKQRYDIAAKQKSTPPQPAAHLSVEPVAPLPPLLPADQPAHPAKIQFKDGMLKIDASNSSLVTTLQQISRATGIDVSGLDHDKRIYGKYGPGSVTEILTKLLNGSGYNYVIVSGITGKSAGKLFLTTGGNTMGDTGSRGAPAGAATSPENSTYESGTPGEVPAAADPTAPPRPKTPQEIFEELRKMHPPQ